MSILDAILSTIAPACCINCSYEGSALCGECAMLAEPSISCCFRCFAPTIGFATCSRCLPDSPAVLVRSPFAFTGVARRLVHEYKFSGNRAAAYAMSWYMSARGPTNYDYVVNISTATQRIRERGFDHARLLARRVSRQIGVPHLEALIRHGQQHQVGLGRQERLHNAQGVFSAAHITFVEGARILLVDDVVTTGATLSEAARVLRAAGALQVEGLVFAQTPPASPASMH